MKSWGQFRQARPREWIKAYDPLPAVDHASGWFDQGGRDFQSLHIYVRKLKRPGRMARAFILSEFGGYSLKVPDHMWDETRKYGYRFYTNREELTEAYLTLLESELRPLLPTGTGCRGLHPDHRRWRSK